MTSDDVQTDDVQTDDVVVPVPPTQDERLATLLHEMFGLTTDPLHQWDLGMIASPDTAAKALCFLRDEQDFAMLLDITVIDYLTFPGYRGARFALVYILKNITTCQRISVKVMIEEDAAAIYSVADLWLNANWAEREVYDQYGINFIGHPNMKRLLNHQEFVGHPLRKDYPAQKRQKLSANDPMLDQLEDRLRTLGYSICGGTLDTQADTVVDADSVCTGANQETDA